MELAAGIEVRVVSGGESARLMDFLHEHYYREEPLTLGTDPPQPDAADEAFLLSNIPHGTCLVALLGDRIVGAVVAGPKTADEAAHLFEDAERLKGTKWGRILSILAVAERDANVCARFDVERALHAHALGVDVSMRGRRIGARLMTELAALARRLKYPLLTVDCTSIYSARLVQQLGYELVNTIRYDSHKDSSGQPVIKPPAPHESLQTYALRL
ncbi:uncharacterized protein LOC115629610 [Scaptodrosophila lebanonensis]|uniref:aralkylamine N-acetyltransferase n=1 Tax=Drosophila lebanonensis TaxID=7225 RepID=A0A6J2U4A9_DROLE|nr:uncharacterized protein LOC115629610 [Scaptodrosophila lebanonensis]